MKIKRNILDNNMTCNQLHKTRDSVQVLRSSCLFTWIGFGSCGVGVWTEDIDSRHPELKRSGVVEVIKTVPASRKKRPVQFLFSESSLRNFGQLAENCEREEVIVQIDGFSHRRERWPSQRIHCWGWCSRSFVNGSVCGRFGYQL